MYKPYYSIIIALVILLTACTLPAPVAPVVPTPIGMPAEVNPPAVPTEVITIEPAETETLPATEVITLTVIQETEQPASAPVETALPEENKYRYSIQIGTPVWTSNFLQTEAGCNWMGIAGQVFSRNDTPVTGMIVEVGGELEGSPVLLLSITGDSTALGPGGYEIKLADKPVASQGSLWLQLHDLMGKPQSEKIYFDTYSGEGECEQNLLIVNFREVSTEQLEQYLPSIFKAP